MQTDSLTVHLALFCKNDLAATTRWIDRHRLEETLLDVCTPDSFTSLRLIVTVITQLPRLTAVCVVSDELIAVSIGRRRAADAGVTPAAAAAVARGAR